MARITTLLFLFICAFPQFAFANATSSSKIGISVVIKETPKCDFHIASEGRPSLSFVPFANCDIKADMIQKQFISTNYQQLTHSSNNEFARVLLIVQ